MPPITRLCTLLGIELPIVGAGTGSIATPRLAAAVTNAGGLGMTGAAGDPPERVVARVQEIRSLTEGPTGVNVILELQPLEAIEAMLEAGIEVLATGFGAPDAAIALATRPARASSIAARRPTRPGAPPRPARTP